MRPLTVGSLTAAHRGLRARRDGGWITRVCRCEEVFPKFRREMPNDKRLARLHRCPRRNAA